MFSVTVPDTSGVQLLSQRTISNGAKEVGAGLELGQRANKKTQERPEEAFIAFIHECGLTHGFTFSFLVKTAEKTGMKHALSNRVVERLRRLREKFGEGIHDHQVDHDHDHLTSTRRDLVPYRTFFLGEIWWVDRYTLGDHRPHREGSTHRPALVTRRQPSPLKAVEMAPSSNRVSDDTDELCLLPAEPVEGLIRGTVFLLPQRRFVRRDEIGGPLGTLCALDKQRVAALMALIRPGEKGPT